MKKSERYLAAVFTLMKRRDDVALSTSKTRLNNTELRLVGEILTAKYQGKRLISTELARRLRVTRSAVSQMVNRLEKEGLVRRAPDETDRKIAYVELTDEALTTYEKDIKGCEEFVERVVKEYGEEKFEQMYALFDEFMQCLEKEKNLIRAK